MLRNAAPPYGGVMPTTTTVLSDLHHEVRGTGPPVIFITGASGDAEHFTRAAERLADEFTTLAYDRRGCSRSAALPRRRNHVDLGPGRRRGVTRRGARARAGDRLRHEPALISFAETADPEDDPLAPVVELAERDPRAAMEAFVRMHTDDATLESLAPALRDRILGNGARFFGQQLPAFATYVPDVERIRAAGIALRLLVSREGVPRLIGATKRLARELGIGVDSIRGHHAPYLQHPEAFAEELRPILRQLA
jgi:hypothetical protein